MKGIPGVGALVVAGLIAAAPAYASTGAVRGKVKDEKGQALQDAVVVMEYQGGVTRKMSVKTNKKGEFTQVGLPPGIYTFTVSKEGFQSVKLDQRVNLGEPTNLEDVKLPSAAAAAAAQAMAAAPPGLAEMSKGRDAFNAGNFDAAEAAYKEVLAKDPTRYDAYNNLGLVYTRKKDLAAAEAAYAKALELKADYEDAHVNLADAYLVSGKGDQAVAAMTKSAAAHPASAKIQYMLGYVAFHTGKSDEALAAFKKTETLDATNAEVHYYLGMLAVGQNNVPEAVSQLEKYLSMSPTNKQNIASAQAVLPALKK